MNENADSELDSRIRAIRQAKKYRNLNLPDITLQNLFQEELRAGLTLKQADDRVRVKLHNIIAPYLGDPDYTAAAGRIAAACQTGDMEQVKEVCAGLLAAHASTRERLPVLDEFYGKIFEKIGRPQTILDLACGLNPLAFPWMDLPVSTRYFAFDIHGPRIDLIHHFFECLGMEQLARQQDILVNPPEQEADAAFFFKEAHRLEQRHRGSNRSMWRALKVRWLLVSLPANSLSGKFDLAERQRALVYGIIKDLPWHVEEILVDTELVFCIDKGKNNH